MNENELVDDAFSAKAKDITAVVAEITKVESGIEKHKAGIAGLTPTLIVAYYRLGSLLMALPGAAGNLKQARGAWLKKAVELCGTKDRVYRARDVFGYFNDPSDHVVRESGKTGEERAEAFNQTLDKLDYFIRDMKYLEADRRKREREEAERAARKSAVVQGVTARAAARPSGENDGEPAPADGKSEPGLADGAARLDAEVEGEPADEEDEEDYCADCAREFVNVCGKDVQQAVAYLIRRYWNKADALAWLTAWVDKERAAGMNPAGAKKPAALKTGWLSARANGRPR